jgi:hypothetical protein
VRAPVASSSKQPVEEKEPSSKRAKKVRKEVLEESDEEIEEPVVAAGPSTTVDEEDNDAELSEIDTDEELVHETTDTTSKRKRKQATKLPKYTPADESSQDRDRRSIFVGNLPMDVTKSKVSLPKCIVLTNSLRKTNSKVIFSPTLHQPRLNRSDSGRSHSLRQLMLFPRHWMPIPRRRA